MDLSISSKIDKASADMLFDLSVLPRRLDSICDTLKFVTCVKTDEFESDWVLIVVADIAGDDDSDSFG